ncbi:hypothetical protein D918_05856 [Trichuris suis]|nr:hypothetical protein D918_05856 [Trichuris suis]
MMLMLGRVLPRRLSTLVKFEHPVNWLLPGAEKLLAAEPLGRLVPVDEFLPIMFDRHPVDAWKNHYVKRDLNAYTSVPLLVYPVLYVGQEGYISDTENTTILQSIDGQHTATSITDEL